MYNFNVIVIDYKIHKFSYDNNTSFEKIYYLLESEYCISRDSFALSYNKLIKPSMNIFETIEPDITIKMYSLINKVILDKLYFSGDKLDFIECPRDMLNLSDYFKKYYDNIDVFFLDNQKKLGLLLFDILSKKDIKKIGGSKKFKENIIHYNKIFSYNPISDKKTIMRPISSTYGLKNVIPLNLITYLNNLKIEEIKSLVIFFEKLNIDYYRNILLGFMAHYIYRKCSLNKLIANGLL